MIELNKIFNEDCVAFMNRQEEPFANVILTSPPYNTDRSTGTCENHSARYDGGKEYQDTLTNEDYTNWTLEVFKGYDKVLEPNGVILYNMSYGSENNELMWLLMADIIRQTPFTIADCIVWKKKNALVNNTSSNHLTRICEFIFVLCRKTEYMTYISNKPKVSERKTGQVMYGNVMNFIEAPNNDGSVDFHKATFSTMLCRKLLGMYAPKGSVIYDSFMGTGTTAVACVKEKYDFVGTELSSKFCEYANRRVKNEQRQLTLW